MKNNYLIGVSLIFVIMLSCGFVSAEMVQQDFGRDFSMDVPGDSDFQKVESEVYADYPFDEKDYFDSNSQIIVIFTSDNMFSEDNVDCNYFELFKIVNSDLEKCVEYQEDGIKVLDPKSDEHSAIVGFHQDGNTVIILGNDVNLIKEMAHSIKFK